MTMHDNLRTITVKHCVILYGMSHVIISCDVVIGRYYVIMSIQLTVLYNLLMPTELHLACVYNTRLIISRFS